MTIKFGPMAFRVPISKADRANIADPQVEPGDGTNWPREAAAISGTWPAAFKNLPAIRPIFPGAMRFIAFNPGEVPTLSQVEANTKDGRVSDAYLATLQLTGTLLVRIQHAKHLKDIAAAGTIGAIGECPTLAMYGPVQLTSDFLRKALLDFNTGMLAASLNEGLPPINPGDRAWEARALLYFLSGSYEPVLRAGATLSSDDAERLPMPQLPLIGNKFTLNVALAWTREPAAELFSAKSKDLEIIPALPFMRHIGANAIREPITGDPLIEKLFEGERSSEPWVNRLKARLKQMGFGALDDSLPLEQTLREFQIAAAGPIAARARTNPAPELPIPEAQLALRHFGDLVAAQNFDPYGGVVSGRANQRTRDLVDRWHHDELRSPLLIVAYKDEDLDAKGCPKTGVAPASNDLWSRQEIKNSKLRMFAADFTRRLDGSGLPESSLEPIGYYASFRSGGPDTLKPNANLRVDLAEVTPERLLSLDQADLIRAMAPGGAGELADIASSFKIIRAVSECENLGYLDQINAYDNAGISYGPCHWAMAEAVDNPKGTTELGGFAAYLRYLEREGIAPEADVFLPQGMAAWIGQDNDASSIARSTSGAAYYSQLCFLDDRGKPRAMTSDGVRSMIPSWRSFYRWVQIGRRYRQIGLGTWRMALRRLHRLAGVPIELPSLVEGEPPTVIRMGGAFSSELLMAQLMRWNVKAPGGVVTGNRDKEKASQYIIRAVQAARQDAANVSAGINSNTFAEVLVRRLRIQLEAFVKDMAAKKVDHSELPRQFDEIADPKWVSDAAANPYSFQLDGKLRTLSIDHGTARIAPLATEP
ncbi:hypothetical protein GR200_30950 [Rhizobium leguminosarum]|uniref:hypothetical protein n=1 Tax=Rhizobium leguminosarum TaxID=384 RepID=UPI0013BB1AD5|nr:hypothetical protein [Rhizobium leguminosarum]NEI59450.1 hypothetical protein [Rhizobium leguminosarum]NEI88290.1 hypothetical protein [Rhizobium leguminosarum]